MNTIQPLLSIIIPTKDRYSCLIPVIEALLHNIDSNDFEIVIHDNSTSNEEVKTYFQSHNDLRLKYYYEGENLSMVDNTIYAVERAKGEYVTFIGDDDLVSPYICEIARDLKEKNIDSLIYNAGFYWWESVVFSKPTSYRKGNSFWIPKNISTEMKLLNSKDEMEVVVEKGGVHFYNLPRFYHGIIKRSLLEKIKKATGTYLPGSCPDMAFSAALSHVTESYYFMNYPVTIFGASKNSGAGWGANKTHFRKIEDATFLPKGIINRWDPQLPKIWSAQTTNAQALYEVFKAFGSERKVNYASFYSSMLANEPFLKNYIFPYLKPKAKNLSFLLKFLKNYLKISTKLILMDTYLSLRYRYGNFKFEISSMKDVDSCMKEMKKIKFTKTNA